MMKPVQVELTVEFHQGKTIMDTARTYPNLLKVILEVVQNAIDSGAQRIDVMVDQQKHCFTIQDNGSGCGVQKFQSALMSLNSTLKAAGKYGQFGRGLVAPLSVAERGFTFTSCDRSCPQYYSYEFDPKKIEPQAKVTIPGRTLPDLKFDPSSKCWWRTEVSARKITRDRRLSALTLKDLKDEISLKFGEAIRSRDILITVELVDPDGDKKSENVVAVEYSGDKLEVPNANNKESGEIIFDLYIAKIGRGGRKGKIAVGTTGNPSRVSISEFIDNTRGILPHEVAQGLSSGIFEGKILCENLKLDPDRTRFMDNEALCALCLELEAWWKHQGKQIVSELRDNDDTSRFQRLGNAVMPYAELLLKQDQFQLIADSIQIGTIGKQHAPVKKKDVLGVDEIPSIAAGGHSFVAPKEGKGHQGGTKPPEKECLPHTPGIVYGNKGRRRTEVKGSSTGLRFAYIEMQNTRVPFEYDPVSGTLTFNLDHPNWSHCESKDVTLIQYEIAVINTAMSLEIERDGDAPLDEKVIDFAFRSLDAQVFAIMNGEAMLKK